MRKIWIVALLSILAASQCFADDKDEDQTQTQEEVAVNYEVIQKGTYSGLKDPLTQVITTTQDWDALWKKHVGIIVPQPVLPEIDFTTSVVAVIALGEKKTSGYQIIVKDVSYSDNNIDIEVTYKTTEPPEHAFTLQVLSQPYLMLRIDKPANGTVKLVNENQQ